MMDRINFLESVSGIRYPEMLVTFFDHFVALKQIVEDSGSVNVLNSTDYNVTFSVKFKNKISRDNALNAINSTNGIITIYKRPINVDVNFPTDTEIIINLQ